MSLGFRECWLPWRLCRRLARPNDNAGRNGACRYRQSSSACSVSLLITRASLAGVHRIQWAAEVNETHREIVVLLTPLSLEMRISGQRKLRSIMRQHCAAPGLTPARLPTRRRCCHRGVHRAAASTPPTSPRPGDSNANMTSLTNRDSIRFGPSGEVVAAAPATGA